MWGRSSINQERLRAAGRLNIEVTTTPYRFAEADRALSDLAHDRVRGAAVVVGASQR